MKAQAARTAADPLLISRVIERAITARAPRARYVAPFNGRLIVALAAWLPTRVLDWIIAQAMGMTRARLRIVAKASRPPAA